MKTYFLLFSVATCSSLLLTPIVRRIIQSPELSEIIKLRSRPRRCL